MQKTTTMMMRTTTMRAASGRLVRGQSSTSILRTTMPTTTAAAAAFSTSRRLEDVATCQLLGRIGSTPAPFKTRDGRPGIRYLFAVNKAGAGASSSGRNDDGGATTPAEDRETCSSSSTSSSTTTSWFTVVSFDERVIERLTAEDLKGARALVDATLELKTRRDEATGGYADQQVLLRQTRLHLIERARRGGGQGQQQGGLPSRDAQSAALEDSFSV